VSKIEDGGPAFPIPLNQGQSWQGMAPCDGMTLRDYMAAKAMQAVIAHHGVYDEEQPMAAMSSSTSLDYHAESVAAIAYVYADAMLLAREVKA